MTCAARLVLRTLAAGFLTHLGIFYTAHAQTETPPPKLEKKEVIPLTPQIDFWSKDAGYLSYRCKDLKLEARSRLSPSKTFSLSGGLFNEKDCQTAIRSLETKGCYCDDAELKCLETEKNPPVGFVCGPGFFCVEIENNKTGLVKIMNLGNHYTRAACEKELAGIERGSGRPAPGSGPAAPVKAKGKYL